MIKVIATDVNTGETILDTTMNHPPRCSDEIRIDSPRGGWYFYVVKRVVWGIGRLSSYLHLDVKPLHDPLDIGEQPSEDDDS